MEPGDATHGGQRRRFNAVNLRAHNALPTPISHCSRATVRPRPLLSSPSIHRGAWSQESRSFSETKKEIEKKKRENEGKRERERERITKATVGRRVLGWSFGWSFGSENGGYGG